MNSFDRDNLAHIQDLFQEKTGVELPARRPARRALRAAAVLAAVLACCTVTALAAGGLFSSLDGDDLALGAVYEGNGVVTVRVENRSDKTLQFQPTLKLKRWTAGEEVTPLSDDVAFEGTKIGPHSGGTMTIDLSRAYDVELLEEPLTDDWYYLVLTNNGFLFGQDWMCSVEFAQTVWTPAEDPEPGRTDPAVLQTIKESLRPYFETVSWDPEERRAMNAEYVEAYTGLFAGVEGKIVPSASPILPGNRISPETPYLTVSPPAPGVIFDESYPPDQQDQLAVTHWTSYDANFKLLGAEGEYALELSASLPSKKYGDDGKTVPLLYLFTYEKSAIGSGQDFAFIYGQLLRFADLEPYQVYEDDRYVCYEVSGLIYSDLTQHVQDLAGQDPDLLLDERSWARAENIYAYYKENLPGLIFSFNGNRTPAD